VLATALPTGFDPAELTAAAGEEVSVEIMNTGDMPHTFTIDELVDSGTVAAGESAMVTFTPSQAGELTFYCTIHTAEVMSGTLQVN